VGAKVDQIKEVVMTLDRVRYECESVRSANRTCLVRGSMTEDVMRDFTADWHKWTAAEKIAAVFFALAFSGTIPAFYAFSVG